ncbi:disease resistance protein RUN1-like [Prosopis cineraria]|uniref:disease resistance protein RUN1-like n=1 Tax=Prosopis cineraria TaxID=364024 RepID=UPI00240FF5FA|nr:disease resistance protein RUN1-like [Prosopis cineraria]XP_054817180.1 disease resistance protein RUN1-like [Prosopis cineraria]XP_054817181.1 disease resistance protein RUN1-like [Prosopis cineraria]XP_054817182.1 disease resistance protein RUN1-like [Prosopis cineraria]
MGIFFIGKDIKFVKGILSSLYVYSSDIQRLVEKSLMTIGDQKIRMHSPLQEMGRETIPQESPSRPEEWSRLWEFDDIDAVMQSDAATLKTEAIVLDLEDLQDRAIRVEALSRMSNLRLLIFRNVKFSGVLENLSWQLEYISWHQYPLTCLPSTFEPYCLMEVNLTDSCSTSIWHDCGGGKVFWWLRKMSLSGSKDLTKRPNFSGFPSLERLDLEGCIKLSQLDASIADLSMA